MATARAESSLVPSSIAHLLAEPATRGATLDALEQYEGPHDAALALATAPALTDLLILLADEGIDHVLFQRVGLLRGRLALEAEDSAAIWAAAFDDDRHLAEVNTGNVLFRTFEEKSTEQLDRVDALSLACQDCLTGNVLGGGRSFDKAFAAAGFNNALEWFGPCMSKSWVAKSSHVDTVSRIFVLLIELLQTPGDLSAPELINGLWWSAAMCTSNRSAVAAEALKLGVFDLVATQLHALGPPAEYVVRAVTPHCTPLDDRRSADSRRRGWNAESIEHRQECLWKCCRSDNAHMQMLLRAKAKVRSRRSTLVRAVQPVARQYGHVRERWR